MNEVIDQLEIFGQSAVPRPVFKIFVFELALGVVNLVLLSQLVHMCLERAILVQCDEQEVYRASLCSPP